MRVAFRFLILGIYCGLSMRVAGAQESLPLREFTEVHTRVVWVQDYSPSNNDILALGQRLKLMGFDSEDGKGERAILGELRNYAKPLMAPDGQRVVYSDQQLQKFYVVNWDGTGKKLLGDGLAVDVWRDPRDNVQWVYAAKRVGKPENVTYRNLRRVKLDDQKTSEKIWDQTEVGCDNFQLSADGTRAGGEFPWPNGGIADLKKKTWQKLAQGCWSSIAPDNSGVSWVFDGPHRNLQFYRPDATEEWKVNLNSVPDVSGADVFQGAEVFHPRWSNHVRYLVATGPYSVRGKINVISGGGPQVEVFLGQFSEDFKTVKAWFQVTRNERGDFYPDAWVAGGEATAVALPGLKNTPVIQTGIWPPVTDGLMFAWNNSAQTNQIPDRPDQPGRACQIKLQGPVVPGRFHELRFLGGVGIPENLDSDVSAAMKSSLTVQMLVTPASITSSQGAICEIGPVERPAFRILQNASALELQHSGRRQQIHQVQAKSAISLTESKTVKPLVVTLTLAPGEASLFVDGRLAASLEGGLNFESWSSGEIRYGSDTWRGSLEAATVYSRVLSLAEIQHQVATNRQRLLGRTVALQNKVTAKCIERSTIPPPAQILPYRRALAVHEFEVQDVLEDSQPRAVKSEIKKGARILVAQWVILDGKILPESAQPAVGTLAELVLESVDEHPELKSERQILDVTELDLPLYYDVSPRPLKP